MSEQVAAQIEASVKFNALAAARKAGEIVEDYSAGERALVASATSLGREGYSSGRVLGYDEVRDSVQEVVYTAILDDRVCEVCAEWDQTYWPNDFGGTLDDGFEATPNDECLGGDYCRCMVILVMA
jgi:hypothetical protein